VTAKVPDDDLVRRLRAGDEAAFTEAFDANHASLVRIARLFTKNESAAEEIAQDTWVAVMNALDSFEGRSSFKTWIVRICVNRAKTRAARDGRQVPVAGLGDDDPPSSSESRFGAFGTFKARPADFQATPETLFAEREVRAAIERFIAELPDAQRAVVTLRDVEGLSSEEVCNALDLSESNQRVLLHRARTRLRDALEELHSTRTT